MKNLIRSKWCGGQLLAFSAIDGPSDFVDGITARTTFDEPGLEFRMPGQCLIRFPGCGESEHWMTGDCFDLNGTRGAFLDTHHLLLEGAQKVVSVGGKFTHIDQGDRTLIGVVEHFDPTLMDADLDKAIEERCAWLNRQPVPQGRREMQRTLTKMLSIMKTQLYSPLGDIKHHWTTPDRWPHRNMWLWDSVFHAIGWRHLDPGITREMISAVFSKQREDGFISHMLNPFKTSDITQPPVLALGVKLVNEQAPDRAWMASLYPKLGAYVEWDLANRDTDGAGLVEWFIEGSVTCRSGESGMDNSPRFDTATQLDATDFNAFLSLECEILAEFAGQLGLKEDVEKWTTHHQRLNKLIVERLWSDEQGFFLDYDVDGKHLSPVLASSGFLPLICGAASPLQASRLAEHLKNPETFGTAFPVPSIAVSDTDHYAKDMWRGPTWININWLIAYGFDRYGMTEVARDLRDRTAMEIEKWTEKYGVSFEYYDDRCEVAPPQLLRKGKCAPDNSPFHQVFHDYGWTATLYADLVYGGCRLEGA